MNELQIHNNQTEILIWLALGGADIDDREALAHIEYGYDGVARRSHSARRVGAAVRSIRLEQARAKGRHTAQEWETLRAVFDRCVSCERPYDELEGGAPTKDHIVPIYMGGCDCIANLQPMCRSCNTGKEGAEDLRSATRSDWVSAYLARVASMSE